MDYSKKTKQTKNVPQKIRNVLGEGARPTKFDVLLNFALNDMYAGGSEKISLQAKTSSFPGKTLDTIPVKYKGRTVLIKGQVKYEQQFTVSFYLTENHDLRAAFLNWIESTENVNYSNKLSDSVTRGQKWNDKNSYLTTIEVQQLYYNEKPDAAKYTLYNAFPIQVSQTDVDYSSQNSVLEFTVTFAYSHFDVISGDANINTENQGVKKQQLGSYVGSYLPPEVEKIANDGLRYASAFSGSLKIPKMANVFI